MAPPIGFKHSEEAKAKIALAMTGRKHVGRKMSSEGCLKLSLAKRGENTWSKGRKLTEEHKNKVIKNLKNGKGVLNASWGKIPWNKGLNLSISHPHMGNKQGKAYGVLKHTQESRQKMSQSQKMRHKLNPGQLAGNKNPAWIFDRSKLKKADEERNSVAHKEWSKSVKNRDGWKCRIANDSCSGCMEAHHILGWKDYPELRYQINNGITLCHKHHPRKREDEIKLSPYFQSLVLKGN